MAFSRTSASDEQHAADNQKQRGYGLIKPNNVVTIHQEENAQRDQYRGSHQAVSATARALAVSVSDVRRHCVPPVLGRAMRL